MIGRRYDIQRTSSRPGEASSVQQALQKSAGGSRCQPLREVTQWIEIELGSVQRTAHGDLDDLSINRSCNQRAANPAPTQGDLDCQIQRLVESDSPCGEYIDTRDLEAGAFMVDLLVLEHKADLLLIHVDHRTVAPVQVSAKTKEAPHGSDQVDNLSGEASRADIRLMDCERSLDPALGWLRE